MITCHIEKLGLMESAHSMMFGMGGVKLDDEVESQTRHTMEIIPSVTRPESQSLNVHNGRYLGIAKGSGVGAS